MSRHRSPGRGYRPLTTSPSAFGSGVYDALVELEALAITADEAVTSLPVGPTGRHKRTLARL
jgi:hypothetical protein